MHPDLDELGTQVALTERRRLSSHIGHVPLLELRGQGAPVLEQGRARAVAPDLPRAGKLRFTAYGTFHPPRRVLPRQHPATRGPGEQSARAGFLRHCDLPRKIAEDEQTAFVARGNEDSSPSRRTWRKGRCREASPKPVLHSYVLCPSKYQTRHMVQNLRLCDSQDRRILLYLVLEGLAYMELRVRI